MNLKNNMNRLYLQLSNAYQTENSIKMKELLSNFDNQYPEYKMQRFQETIEVLQTIGYDGPLITYPIASLDINSLRYNIIGCLVTIEKILKQNHFQPIPWVSVHHTNSYSSFSINPSNILYQKNNSVLTVHNLLEIVDYSISVFYIVYPNKQIRKAKMIISILKNLKNIFCGKHANQPCKDGLYALIQFLLDHVQPNLEKEPSDSIRMISLVTLTSEFFRRLLNESN